MPTEDNHDLDPTLDPRTCARIGRLEEVLSALSAGKPLPPLTPARGDIEARLVAIERQLEVLFVHVMPLTVDHMMREEMQRIKAEESSIGRQRSSNAD